MTQTPITLKDGLILRAATPDDVSALAEFNARIHGGGPDNPPEDAAMLRQWVHDLADGSHPTCDASLFTLVEDPAADGKIVSSMCVIPQTWRYDGVPFAMARPELVGTDKDYRNRGLVRAQFDWHHTWCAQNDIDVQGITGIPYYYRLFGYEYALNLQGYRKGTAGTLPLKSEEPEPCRFRPADAGDIPFLLELDRLSAKRNLISVAREADLWRYELSGMHPDNINHRTMVIITNKVGERLGFYSYATPLWRTSMAVLHLEFKPGMNSAQLMPSVLRDAWQRGESIAKRTNKECSALLLALGETHPAYDLCRGWCRVEGKPYAWYLRVADLPVFLQTIAPALEKHLSASLFAGYSGAFRINFYKGGLKITFEDGKMVGVNDWRASDEEGADVNIPNPLFLQVLFGYRTLEEVHHIFPDAYDKDAQNAELLKALFPKVINEWIWTLS
ncbi:MAG TPA: GNAT family N-acetyltransferase [Chloroflexi bacterium]|nr:GNAT family N-acetyltransferase [Chloroflexota bacterium]